MDSRTKILAEIVNEREKQDTKWGVQNHDPSIWCLILGEEFGEVQKAVMESRLANDRYSEDPSRENYTKYRLWADNYRTELIQTAAVCVSMLECLDRRSSRVI